MRVFSSWAREALFLNNREQIAPWPLKWGPLFVSIKGYMHSSKNMAVVPAQPGCGQITSTCCHFRHPSPTLRCRSGSITPVKLLLSAFDSQIFSTKNTGKWKIVSQRQLYYSLYLWHDFTGQKGDKYWLYCLYEAQIMVLIPNNVNLFTSNS